MLESETGKVPVSCSVGRPGGPRWVAHPKIFGLVGHNVFGPSNNWPGFSLILMNISKIGATRCQILS